MNTQKKLTKQLSIENKVYTLESGMLASQANASVLATCGGTSVLAVVVTGGDSRGDYMPLQIIYEERYYARGVFKDSKFTKREAKPSDKAVLIGRMVDRSFRSMLNPNIRTEIQVVITCLSHDGVNQPETLATLAASAALSKTKVKLIQQELISPDYNTNEDIKLIFFNPIEQKYAIFSGDNSKLQKQIKEQVFANQLELTKSLESYLELELSYIKALSVTISNSFLIVIKDKKTGRDIIWMDSQELSDWQAKDDINAELINEARNAATNKGFDLSSTSIAKTQNRYIEASLLQNPISTVKVAYVNSRQNLFRPVQEALLKCTTILDLKGQSQMFSEFFANGVTQIEIDVMKQIILRQSPAILVYFDVLSREANIVTGQNSWIVNPNYEELNNSLADITVSGFDNKITMLEAGAKLVSEEILAQGLKVAQSCINQFNHYQKEFLTLDQ
jgi:ribonuclease PH